MENKAIDYVRREAECESFFIENGPFRHLCTPGEEQEIIFRNQDDFKFGVTAQAMALVEARAAGLNVRLYAFALMSNHIHQLVSGTDKDCREYFRILKAKLKRYLAGEADLSGFECDLLPVGDLNSLRNVIAYIHRNGFVNNLRETPFSYEWSTGMYYFNQSTRKLPLTKVSELSYRVRQQLFKSRVNFDLDNLSVSDNYVSPLSFCEIEKGESVFRDAHKYFYLISRSVESYGSIAKTLGDRVFLNDEEMFGVVCYKSKEMFKVKSPKLLSPQDRISMAKLMHHEYNASNKQISRMLNLDRSVVEGLFPKPV